MWPKTRPGGTGVCVKKRVGALYVRTNMGRGSSLAYVAQVAPPNRVQQSSAVQSCPSAQVRDPHLCSGPIRFAPSTFCPGSLRFVLLTSGSSPSLLACTTLVLASPTVIIRAETGCCSSSPCWTHSAWTIHGENSPQQVFPWVGITSWRRRNRSTCPREVRRQIYREAPVFRCDFRVSLSSPAA